MSIQPALSEKEWEDVGAAHWPYSNAAYNAIFGGSSDRNNRHAHAALALHGQPFGFTWADVDAIRSAIQDTVAAADLLDANAKDTEATNARIAHLESLADRISALLPPRK